MGTRAICFYCYNFEIPLQGKKRELYRLKKTSTELIDGFIYIVIEGRVAERSPYLHFYSKDAAGMRIKKMGEKSPQFPNRKVEQYI